MPANLPPAPVCKENGLLWGMPGCLVLKGKSVTMFTRLLLSTVLLGFDKFRLRLYSRVN